MRQIEELKSKLAEVCDLVDELLIHETYESEKYIALELLRESLEILNEMRTSESWEKERLVDEVYQESFGSENNEIRDNLKAIVKREIMDKILSARHRYKVLR